MEEVAFLENGTKVAAVNTKTYIFQLNMSRGPESDLIRTVNIPAVVSPRKPFYMMFGINIKDSNMSVNEELKKNNGVVIRLVSDINPLCTCTTVIWRDYTCALENKMSLLSHPKLCILGL